MSENGALVKRPEAGPDLRLRAFEKFLSSPEITLSDVAKGLGVSKQYLYRIAKEQRWPERRAHALGRIGNVKMEEALEQAVVELRAKVPQRILKLDLLCEDSDPKVALRAITAWFAILKALASGVDQDRPLAIEVHNDLRDQRQVIVNEAPIDVVDSEAT